MKYNKYRKLVERGIPISRVNISSMIYDKTTQERLVLITTELKNHPINKIWHVVAFAVLDGEIIYMKEDNSE